jgi:amidase
MVFEFAVTRSVRDTAALLDCVHGAMPGDPYTVVPPERPYAQEVDADPGSLRIGLAARHDDVEIHPDCVAATEEAARTLEGLGHRVEDSRPSQVVSSVLMPHALVVVAVAQARTVESFGQLLGRELGPDDMDSDNWLVTAMGQKVTGTQYLAAIEGIQTYQREVAAWWEDGFDLLLTPTIAAPPPKIGELVPDPEKPLDAFMRTGGLLPFTIPFNVTGQPAVSLPLHWNAAGLPIGVQIVAAFGREDLLIRVASQLERAVDWARRRPRIHA